MSKPIEFKLSGSNKLRISLVEGKLDIRTMYLKDGEYAFGKGVRVPADLADDIVAAIQTVTGSSAGGAEPKSKQPAKLWARDGKLYVIKPIRADMDFESKDVVTHENKDNALDEHGLKGDGLYLFVRSAGKAKFKLLRRWVVAKESWVPVEDSAWERL